MADWRTTAPPNRDLARLSLTFREMVAVVTPVLYKSLCIRIPISSSCHKSLENLLSSSSLGFHSTTKIVVTIPQEMSKTDHVCQVEDFEFRNSGYLPCAELFRFPTRSHSETLNCLIRLLMTKIPMHRLKSFRYVGLAERLKDVLTPPGLTTFRWIHSAPLHFETPRLLCVRQSESVYEICRNECFPNDSNQRMTQPGLKRISVSCLLPNPIGNWPFQMILDNLPTLTHLALGFESLVMGHHAKNIRWPDNTSMAKTL